MIFHATEMFQAGADLLRLASLAMATDRFWEVGTNLLDAGMKIIEAAKTGKCPCECAKPEECQDCRREEGCLGYPYVIV
ncbi:MAG TPA: hypothetical protein VJ860_14920 [Polyangia bacterium]|jgi:hypothetical protein|nr:hypothetical protein [Polyangia bacterium]